jgi:hypothetical protein
VLDRLHDEDDGRRDLAVAGLGVVGAAGAQVVGQLEAAAAVEDPEDAGRALDRGRDLDRRARALQQPQVGVAAGERGEAVGAQPDADLDVWRRISAVNERGSGCAWTISTLTADPGRRALDPCAGMAAR